MHAFSFVSSLRRSAVSLTALVQRTDHGQADRATCWLMAIMALTGALRAADRVSAATTLTPDTGRMVIEAHGLPAPVTPIFSATAEQTFRLSIAEITGRAHVQLHVVQGRPEKMS